MIAELRTAFAFLTILPFGRQEPIGQPGRSFAYFPLIGLTIGIILAAAATFLKSQSQDLMAFVILAIWVILTGGLHLDGFADTCDGLLATVDADRRLEIMKDPRCGSWAVIGLILLLLGKWIALQTLEPASLIIAPIAGRWSMILAAYIFPYARASGLGAYFRLGLGRRQVIVGTIFSAILITGFSIVRGKLGILGLLAGPPLIVAVAGRWAAGRLGGGLTGDVYGALCELTELATLLALQVLA